ncbi:MAG: hypothetical protein BEN19_06080 [Epulopiscium sp. Nuni2H_MBin003]|nr:MAG: hypothetical protein BEN19_06080 [Epulopiscium sp. Nuni2H_MBin003]
MLVGFSISLTRACILITIAIVADLLWEENDFYTSLSLAALAILVQNPFALYSVSFQLSFGAMICIGIFMWIKEQLSEKYEINLNNISALLMSGAITLGIAPILSYHFSSVSWIGIFINIFIMIIFSGLIVLISSVILIELVNISIAKYLAPLIIAIINGCNMFVGEVASWSWGIIYSGNVTIFEGLLYYSVLTCIILGILYYQYRKPLWSYSIIVVLGCICVSFMPNKLEITQLYVGQGDASIVRTPSNEIILIDGGIRSSATKIQNHIWYMGCNEIGLAIVSHADLDHIGGILELIRNNHPIDTVVIPAVNIEDELLVELYDLCKPRNISIIKASQGESINFDGVTINVIAPEVNSTSTNKNESSLVFELVYEDFKMLYTGDIGMQTEASIDNYLSDIDILKVAHHGSMTSTNEYFLQTTKPEVAIISCGLNNWYGHPYGGTLATLDRAGTEVFRTDLSGMIKITVDKDDITITTHIP